MSFELNFKSFNIPATEYCRAETLTAARVSSGKMEDLLTRIAFWSNGKFGVRISGRDANC